jgi:serine/threonine protein kinase
MSNDCLVDELAEEFARCLRAGDEPDAEGFAARFPDKRTEVREVLACVAVLERLKPRADATPPPEAVPAALPARFGDYRIVRELGRGGMGVVFEAEQESLARRVALKVLPPQLVAGEKAKARFRNEALAAARLHHTHIVPVFEVGEADGQCFYAMQLIPGRGLDRGRFAPDGSPRWSPAQVARFGAEVADALEYAHARGVVHRDIKPSNLIRDDRGAVWVTDFGVAKVVEYDPITVTGEVVGTMR